MLIEKAWPVAGGGQFIILYVKKNSSLKPSEWERFLVIWTVKVVNLKLIFGSERAMNLNTVLKIFITYFIFQDFFRTVRNYPCTDSKFVIKITKILVSLMFNEFKHS